MEDNFNLNCFHRVLKRKNFCIHCGAVFIDKNIYGLVQNKSKYTIEIDPNEIFLQMRRIDSLINLKSNQEAIKDISKNYLSKRKKILKKIKEFINQFKFQDKTYHLSVFLLDYIISECKIDNLLNLENIAVGCLVISIKFNELDVTIPNLTFFQYIFDNIYYKIEEVKTFELFCLRILNYNLTFVTAYNFLELFLRNGIILSNDLTDNGKNNRDKLYHLSRIFAFVYEILDFTIENNNYMSFSSFEVACSVVYLAREIIKLKPWNQVFEFLYDFRFEAFKSCYDFVKSNYFTIRNSGDTICLYINADDSPTKKTRNGIPIGVQDTGKDLKIFETINFNLETYSSSANKIPGLRKKYSKSQENTLEFKNFTQLEKYSSKPQNFLFESNHNSLVKAENTEFQSQITAFKLNLKKEPDISNEIFTIYPDNKLSTQENSPIKKFSNNNVSRNYSKFAIYKPGNKGFKTANNSGIRDNSNNKNISMNNNVEQTKPYVKPQLFITNKNPIKEKILQHEINKVHRNLTMNTIVTEGNNLKNTSNMQLLKSNINKKPESKRPSSTINHGNLPLSTIKENSVHNSRISKILEPKLSSRNAKEKENFYKERGSINKNTSVSNNPKINENTLKTINKKNSFSASKTQNEDKSIIKQIPKYKESFALLKMLNNRNKDLNTINLDIINNKVRVSSKNSLIKK